MCTTAPCRICGLILAIVASALAGCAGWAPLRLDPDRPELKGADEIKVTLLNGRTLHLFHPHLRGDTLVAVRQGNRPAQDAWGGTSVPKSAVGWAESDSLVEFRLERAAVVAPGSVATGSQKPRQEAHIPLRNISRLEMWQEGSGVPTVAVVAIGVVMLAVVVAGNSDAFEVEGVGLNSCPLIDSWTGARWVLDSGTFGGAIFPALTRTDLDNLPHAVAIGGDIHLRLRNAFDETEYVDALTLLAVDHAPGVEVAPGPDGALLPLTAPAPPLAARDFRGADALDAVRHVDDLAWTSSPGQRDPARLSDIRDGLELEFARPPDATRARLVVDGHSGVWAALLMREFMGLRGRDAAAWMEEIEADSAAARAIGRRFAAEGFLAVSVLTDRGWERQGTIHEAGPEVSKRQALALDLSRAAGDPIRVRLESAPLFWVLDGVALDATAPAPVQVQVLDATRAMSRVGADIRPRLQAIDRDYFVMERGDSADVTFHAPPIPPGLERSYLARTTGWYRIHAPQAGVPRPDLIQRLNEEPYAISRIAVEKFNALLARVQAHPSLEVKP